jgi:hypothetical protein
MAVVEMQIIEPVHDAPFFGTGEVSFRGTVTTPAEELDGLVLYYRWYSSLFPAQKERYSMNPEAVADPADPYDDVLGMGTQAITLAAFDRPEETDADLDAVGSGGMTGGSDGDTPCVVHVFIAAIILPADGALLSRSGSILEARAPALWGKLDDATGLFVKNDDYHALNRLRYRWEFRPVGPPAGRRAVSLAPSPDDVTFIPDADPLLTRIQYEASLPSGVDGAYRMVLHVEDSQEILGGDTASIRVTVNP